MTWAQNRRLNFRELQTRRVGTLSLATEVTTLAPVLVSGPLGTSVYGKFTPVREKVRGHP